MDLVLLRMLPVLILKIHNKIPQIDGIKEVCSWILKPKTMKSNVIS